MGENDFKKEYIQGSRNKLTVWLRRYGQYIASLQDSWTHKAQQRKKNTNSRFSVSVHAVCPLLQELYDTNEAQFARCKFFSAKHGLLKKLAEAFCFGAEEVATLRFLQFSF